MLSVRPWIEEDIPYLCQSVSREKWGHTRSDIERCWHWEPKGCLIAEEGERVGHVSSISYGKLGWIGLLIVNPEHRGKGIGTSLVGKAIVHLRETGVESIRLEAVEEFVPFYETLGFRQEFASLRYQGQMTPRMSESHNAEVSLIRPEEMAELAAFDSEYFGAGRTQILETLAEVDPLRSFVAREEEILGYMMCRKTENGYWMGPWVSSDAGVSEDLLAAALRSLDESDRMLRFGFPSTNEEMQRLMRKNGILPRGKSIRMVLGKRSCGGNPSRIFGIAGPEKG